VNITPTGKLVKVNIDHNAGSEQLDRTGFQAHIFNRSYISNRKQWKPIPDSRTSASIIPAFSPYSAIHVFPEFIAQRLNTWNLRRKPLRMAAGYSGF